MTDVEMTDECEDAVNSFIDALVCLFVNLFMFSLIVLLKFCFNFKGQLTPIFNLLSAHSTTRVLYVGTRFI